MMQKAAGKREVSFIVNGEAKTVRTYPMERLLDVLRHELGLTGTKEGCGEGECGACSVVMDGALVDSCLVPIAQAQGASVVTIEGLAQDRRFRALEESFLECGGAQCGICTPGMILAAACLLEKKAAPMTDEIREALSGNLCRCTGYTQILEAVAQAARRAAQQSRA